MRACVSGFRVAKSNLSMALCILTALSFFNFDIFESSSSVESTSEFLALEIKLDTRIKAKPAG